MCRSLYILGLIALFTAGCTGARNVDRPVELRVVIESNEPIHSADYVVHQSGDTAHFVIHFGEGQERHGAVAADIGSAFADFANAVRMATRGAPTATDEDRQVITAELITDAGNRRVAQYVSGFSDAYELLANAGRWTELHTEVTRHTGRGYFWYTGPQQRLTAPPLRDAGE